MKEMSRVPHWSIFDPSSLDSQDCMQQLHAASPCVAGDALLLVPPEGQSCFKAVYQGAAKPHIYLTGAFGGGPHALAWLLHARQDATG